MSLKKAKVARFEDTPDYEGFNDRQQSTYNSGPGDRALFLSELRETIRQSDGQNNINDYISGLGQSNIECVDSRTGKVTNAFREELRFIAEKQLTSLEIAATKSAAPDLFGLLRRRCEACQDSCSGYHPQSVVCPLASSEMDFPTFCQNCGCPACFHLVVQANDSLTKSMSDSITSFNIRQQDINFNASLAIFEIKDQVNAAKNIASLTILLRTEGFEILSLENRALDAEEALFLRSRQLAVQESNLSEMVNQGFDGDKKRKKEQIRGQGGSENIFNAVSRNDLHLLDTVVNNQEQSIWKKAQRYLQGNRRQQSQTVGNENTNLFNIIGQIQQRDNTFIGSGLSNLNDTANISHNESVQTKMVKDLQQGLQSQVDARKRSHKFKITQKAQNQRKLSSAVSKISSSKKEQKSSMMTNRLINVMQQSKHISQLMGNRCLIITVSSTSQSNLDVKLRNEIVPSLAGLVSRDELFCSYISQNRIHAIEDSVLFAPQIYRLQKSIILSEPAAGLFKPSRKFTKTNVVRETDHGTVYTDLAVWYKDMNIIDDQMKHQRSILAQVNIDNVGSRQAKEIRQNLEELEEKQKCIEARKPTGASVQTHLIDLSDKTNSMTLARPSMVMSGTGKRRQTGLNRALTVSIRQKNSTTAEDYGVEKEGGQNEQKFETVGVQKPRENTYWTAKDDDTNKMLKNYGTMLDFFDYSGVRVQETVRLADLEQPPSFGLQLKPDKEMREIWNQKIRQGTQGITRSCNLFAVAKVGSPNMIFPSTLDVQMRNYQDHEQYYQLADLFFPSTAKSQFTVLIFRPLIVSNEMSDLFVEILKANDFLIIKRKRRALTHPEASYLCKLEKISAENIELYFNTVLSGPSEIVIVSKVGAVQDAVTLCHGSQTGRRRKNIIDLDTDGSRTNVDSLSAMFEIAPFSSFNEFVDLEDFLVQHTRLKKYKKEGKGDNDSQKQVIDALSIQKIEEIRIELTNFTRNFNIAAVAAPDEGESLKLMSLLTPRVSQLEEIILILNPLYTNQRIAAEELLVRMQYRFIKIAKRTLNAEQAHLIFQDKYGDNQEGKKLIDKLENREVHMYHLTKLAGEREVRALFARSDVILEDYLFRNTDIIETKGAYLPDSLPFLFLYMDSGVMHEHAMEIIYEPKQIQFTSRDLLNRFTKRDIQQILETCLFTAIGDSILRVVHNEQGEIVPRANLKQIMQYQHGMLSGHNRPYFYEQNKGQQEDSQFQLMLSQTAQNDSSIRYIVEGDSHTVFEIRFHKISHKGDISVASRFEIDDVQIDEGEEPVRNTTITTTEKRVHFENDVEQIQDKTMAQKEIFYFFEKFLSLNFYYKQVNRQLGGGVAPTFYRFKLCPQDGSQLNRVYEVEEHMGRIFLEEVAEMQRAHARQLQHAKEARGRNQDLLSDMSAIDKQQSLPAFILGSQIAKMCKKLEKVQCKDQTQLQGAGDIVYSQKQQMLHGKVKFPQFYYLADKVRFSTMLKSMKTRWYLYLSVLETEIIEHKLNQIIESLTFRFTRQEELLSLIPDRMTEFNLRMNSIVQVLDNDSTNKQYGTRARRQDDKSDNKKRKFYKDVYADPNRAENLRNVLDSVMYVVNKPVLQRKDSKSSKITKSSYKSEQWDQQGYSIHKNIGISGVEVAKRCKFQLLASILYLINFWLRKVNRRTELFSNSKLNGKENEEQYDAVLDSILQGIEQNYGNDEVNHVLDLIALRRGNDSKFEAILREKIQRQVEIQKEKEREKDTDKRIRRNDPTMPIDDLIKQVQEESKEVDEKNLFGQLKQFLKSRAGDDQQLNAGQSSQFMTLLKSTKAKLGANSAKLADEFVLKSQLEAEAKAAGRSGIQEKISFVKMEYFLYGFTDAHRLMKQLQKMGTIIKEFEAQMLVLEQDDSDVRRRLSQVPVGMAGGANNPYINQLPAQLKAESERINNEIKSLSHQIKDTRYQMAKQETELLIVFRELMTYDYIVAEHYFDGDRLTKQNNWASDKTDDQYLVPTKTFWLPIAIEEPVINPDSQEGKDFMKTVPQEVNPRTFQPQSIKDANEHFENYQQVQTTGGKATDHDTTMQSIQAKSVSSRTGSTQRDVEPLKKLNVSMLRYPESRPARPEFISFQKLENPSFKKEATHINELGQTLKQKIAPTDRGFGQSDPLGQLHLKVTLDELINESIKTYMLNDATSSTAPGLHKQECRQLAQQSIKKMQQKQISCEEYEELNFETSFRIYAKDQLVEQNQLNNFVKSVADL